MEGRGEGDPNSGHRGKFSKGLIAPAGGSGSAQAHSGGSWGTVEEPLEEELGSSRHRAEGGVSIREWGAASGRGSAAGVYTTVGGSDASERRDFSNSGGHRRTADARCTVQVQPSTRQAQCGLVSAGGAGQPGPGIFARDSPTEIRYH